MVPSQSLDTVEHGNRRDGSPCFAAVLQSSQVSLGDLGREVLDGLLRRTGFDRAFLVHYLGHNGTRFRVLGARRRLAGEGKRSRENLGDQPDPEIFLHSGVLEQARRAGETVLEADCLVELPPPGAEERRTVLCRAFALTSRGTAALYVDVSALPAGEIPAALGLFDDLVAQGLAVLRSAFLEDEIRRVSSVADSPVVTEPATESGAGEDDDGGDEAPWDVQDDELPSYHGIIGKSDRLREIFDVVEKVKNNDFNVCIFGESGSGKELLARAIHRAGRRRDREFISENCGAISETLLESELFGHLKGSFTGADNDRKGLFELADGGTLFLDEIGDMSEGMQRKLLRVLQEGVIRPIGSKETIRVDVRVICASNRDLKVLMEKGRFRPDLYYRLNVINLEMPPLRERMGDIPYLVRSILRDLESQGSGRRRLSQSAMKALMSYSWPGNVRELANVLQRLVISGGRRIVTRKEVLPLLSAGPSRTYVSDEVDEEQDDQQIVLRIPRRGTFNEIIAECEKAVLLNALRENRWNKSRVTKILRIPRQSLYNKIAKYNLRKRWPGESS